MVTVEDTEIQRKLDALSDEETRRMLFESLKQGARVLRDTSQGLMLQKNWNFNPKQRENGVGMKSLPELCEVKVFLKTWLALHWLESGTEQRQLKKDHPKDSKHRRTLRKGENRGRVQGTHFFRDARKNEEPILSAIKSEFDKQFETTIK